MLYLRCLQAFSDNLQSCHFPVYHSINSYIFLSKFSNFLVIISQENNHLLCMLDRGIDDMKAGRELPLEDAFCKITELRDARRNARI